MFRRGVGYWLSFEWVADVATRLGASDDAAQVIWLIVALIAIWGVLVPALRWIM